jgi:hypothetical protein
MKESKMEIRERLLEFLKFKSLNKNRFYKLTGLSNGYLDKKGGISGEATKKILDVFPELNHQWLIYGVGPMLRVDNLSYASIKMADELIQSSEKITGLLQSVKDQITRLSTEMNNFEADIRTFRNSVEAPKYTDTFSGLTTDGALAAEKPDLKSQSRKK